MLARKKGILKASPSWTYNLHGRSCLSDSEASSDEEISPEESRLPISEDARLLRELDLSARPDDAVFKSNPWTIAKVNAASRPQHAGKSPTTNMSRTKEAKSKGASGRIVDAFKIQASKPARKRTNSGTTNKKARKANRSEHTKSHSHHSLNKSSISIVRQLMPPVSHLGSKRKPHELLSMAADLSNKSPSTVSTFQYPVKAIAIPKTGHHEDFTPHISSVESSSEEVLSHSDAPDVHRAEISDASLDIGPPSSDMDFSASLASPIECLVPNAIHAPGAKFLCTNLGTRYGKLKGVEPSLGGILRSPQSSPLRTMSYYDYVPRTVHSSPLRNDPNKRSFPALPMKKTMSSYDSIPQPKFPSHSNLDTSSHYPLQRDSPSQLAGAGPEEPKFKPRNSVSIRRPLRDAYDAFPLSPDSTWSSLPVPAKRQRQHVPPEKSSGRFKLARLADPKLPENAVDSTTEYSGSSKITTYLPPPRSGPKHGSDGSEDGQRSSGVTSWNIKRIGNPNAFSSRKTCQSNTISERSDHPSKRRDSEGELLLPFHSQNLSDRYEKLRQAARKRKHPAMQLWNALDLPSCGQVFLDNWNPKGWELSSDVVDDVNDSMVKDRPCEMQIISWEGCTLSGDSSCGAVGC